MPIIRYIGTMSLLLHYGLQALQRLKIDLDAYGLGTTSNQILTLPV